MITFYLDWLAFMILYIIYTNIRVFGMNEKNYGTT